MAACRVGKADGGVMTRRFREIWARSADGLKLFARSYGDETDERPAVVCLPGLARNSADFHDFAAALTNPDDEPRHVLAVDYRGRGRSDHDADPSRYAVPVEVADLKATLTAAGIPQAVFVGTSRGGMVAMALAASDPGLVAGAVLNDIGPVVERAGLLRIKGYVGKLSAPRNLAEAAGTLEALFGAQFPNLSDRDWQSWAAATWNENGGRLGLSYDPALARTLDPVGPDSEMPDLWHLFEALKGVPVMVVRGANSDILSPETAERMREAHPDLDLVTVPDQGHTPLLHTPDVLAAVRSFLSRFDS